MLEFNFILLEGIELSRTNDQKKYKQYNRFEYKLFKPEGGNKQKQYFCVSSKRIIQINDENSVGPAELGMVW